VLAGVAAGTIAVLLISSLEMVPRALGHSVSGVLGQVFPRRPTWLGRMPPRP